MNCTQKPPPGTQLLKFAGECFEITLDVPADAKGRAFLRTNLRNAALRREEIIAATDADMPLVAGDWHDLPMRPEPETPGRFALRLPLTEVGFFAAKACFLPEGETTPSFPNGNDITIKVEPAHAACANTVYTAFVRQFGAALTENPVAPKLHDAIARLNDRGYTVIPPSGTFRDLIRQLDTILGTMRFRILQLLPVQPTPTTYARMGTFGSPFAARDPVDVDAALAEFDTSATPLDQFRELTTAVHAHGARLFLDMPANHTGWASTIQEHHPEWFARLPDGSFKSPGAWGVTWADLVELDYSQKELRTYFANVFLFWCRQGVDGFRCDAGYMIPEAIWTYVVARVRSAYPDTVFLLEGLGGKISVTERLLSHANLDWAYSEIFQTENRADFERYLPGAIALSERAGPLIHYAETHDNARLAARGGPVYATMRTALAALFSHHGAFGITNGVEWFATRKLDVHGAEPLNWDAPTNQVLFIRRLNTLLGIHPAFTRRAKLRLIQNGPGNSLALLREAPGGVLLVLVNLDCRAAQPVAWPAADFAPTPVTDLLTGRALSPTQPEIDLHPGEVLCLTTNPDDLAALQAALDAPFAEPAEALRLRRNQLALRVREALALHPADTPVEPDELGAELTRDPAAFCLACTPPPVSAAAFPPLAPVVEWAFPEDTRRTVMVPPGHLLYIHAPNPFRAELLSDDIVAEDTSLPLDNGHHGTLLILPATPLKKHLRLTLKLHVFQDEGRIENRSAAVLALADPQCVRARISRSGAALRALHPGLTTLLANKRATMAHVPAAWGELHSQYHALLALNLDARVPVDRTIFLTRCRMWLRRSGYSAAIDKDCLTTFSADPSGSSAQWLFDVPCGMGARLPLTLTLTLAPEHNRLLMTFTPGAMRGPAPAPDEPFQLVLRPDIEWRSFHTTTKAYAGPERAFPAATTSDASGFTFAPDPAHPCAVTLYADNGAFHSEPEWHYQIHHEIEAQRGLDPDSDLFSPGWFHIDLHPRQTALLVAEHRGGEDAPLPPVPAPLPAPSLPTSPLPLPTTFRRAMHAYVVNRDAFKTVIAGYPWFLDWGRDTLIVLRGLIADGQTDTALQILREFGRFEENGTLPNIIHGNTVGNRDTSDAPLWFITAVADLAAKSGPAKILAADCSGRPLLSVLASIAAGYRDGTPNGIKMDPASGLIFSPPHFTWMDTNYPAATPRRGYPVEIQALWIAALDFLAAHDPSHDWAALAAKARASFIQCFILPGSHALADCLRADTPDTSAFNATPEDAIRPNQLLAITLRTLTDPAHTLPVLQSARTLLIPGAIRSLADAPVQTPQPVWRDGQLLNDPHHPFHPHYQGDEDTSRKPAYHNGTAWSWPFPSYAEALLLVHGPAAKPAARALLASASLLLNDGCLGHLPEITDAVTPHLQRGCPAQAWSVSEFLRVELLVR